MYSHQNHGSGAGAATVREPDDPDADLVFDFSDMGTPDLGGVVLVLTARQIAERDRRQVWVKSMPDRTWRLLGALGLDNLFKLFPNSGEHLN